jgi:hypothetical protein
MQTGGKGIITQLFEAAASIVYPIRPQIAIGGPP